MTPSSPASAEPPGRGGVDAVTLVGMMGAGKSAVGEILASRLGWAWVDTDAEVELAAGRTIAEVFEDPGEVAFRALEAKALAVALAGEVPVVVSVGGGAVLRADNRAVLRRRGLIVWLRAEVSTLEARVAESTHRPLLAGGRALAELYAERRPHYQALADAVVDVDALTPGEVAERVAGRVDDARLGVASA